MLEGWRAYCALQDHDEQQVAPKGPANRATDSSTIKSVGGLNATETSETDALGHETSKGHL
jgi:hypothetical protein